MDNFYIWIEAKKEGEMIGEKRKPLMIINEGRSRL
jgi:hypothetical protein